MAMTDPVADLLTRVRNASKERHEKVEIPASRIKANIVRVLKEEGFVKNFRLMRNFRGHPVIKVYLRYDQGQGVIHGIRRISRPGLRKYFGYREIPRSMGGAGVTIFSTSQGVLTGKNARRRKLGGEVLCEVW